MQAPGEPPIPTPDTPTPEHFSLPNPFEALSKAVDAIGRAQPFAFSPPKQSNSPNTGALPPALDQQRAASVQDAVQLRDEAAGMGQNLRSPSNVPSIDWQQIEATLTQPASVAQNKIDAAVAGLQQHASSSGGLSSCAQQQQLSMAAEALRNAAASSPSPPLFPGGTASARWALTMSTHCSRRRSIFVPLAALSSLTRPLLCLWPL